MTDRRQTPDDESSGEVREVDPAPRIGKELSIPLAQEEIEWLEADLEDVSDWGSTEDWSGWR